MANFFAVALLSCFCLAMGATHEGKSGALEASMVQGVSQAAKDISKSGKEDASVEEAVNFLVTGIPDSTELKVIDDTLERAKTHVMDKLVVQFEEEQLSLKTKMEHLLNVTAQAVDALAAAQSKDPAVDKCMYDTNALRKAYDDCQANISSATGQKESACNASQGYSPGIFDIAAADETKHYTPTVQCNFSTFTIVGRSEKCDHFVQFVPDVAENTWDSLESAWSEKEDVCSNSTNTVNQTSSDCKSKLTAYEQAWTSCEQLKAGRALVRCQFENALARKCKALKQFDDQIKKVQDSQRDAQARYDRVRMAYCLLDKYRHTNQQYCLDEDAKDECKTDLAYFYNETIGTIDYLAEKRAEAESLMPCWENTPFVLGKDGDKAGFTYNPTTGYYDPFQENFKADMHYNSMRVIHGTSGFLAAEIRGSLCEQPGAITGIAESILEV